MPSSQSSLLYNETRVISDLFEVNLRQKGDEGWISEQFRICPGCIRVIRFIKDIENHQKLNADTEFLFDEFDYITDPNNWASESVMREDAIIQMLTSQFNGGLELRNIEDFNQHVSSCLEKADNSFDVEDGIWEISREDPPSQKRMIDLMCHFSKKENGYRWNWKEGMWPDEEDSITDYLDNYTFLSVVDKIPVAYCAVSLYHVYSKDDHWIVSLIPRDEKNQVWTGALVKNIDGYVEHGLRAVLHDLYTFPEYRRNGFAKETLNYAKDMVGLDPDNLIVTEPLSVLSRGLIESFCTDRVVLLGDSETPSSGSYLLEGYSYPRQELPS